MFEPAVYNESSPGCANSGRPLILCIQLLPSNGIAGAGGPKPTPLVPRSAIASWIG